MVASDAELLKITQEYAICVMGVVIWDWLVCLGGEWKIVWKAEWSLIKILYLFARYWTLGTLGFCLWAFTATFENDACERVVHWIPATCALITLSTECILAVRTYALWGRPKWLLGVITFCLLLETGCLILGSVLIKPVFPPGVPGPCVPTSSSAGNYLYFLSPFFVDCVFTGLCFYKAMQINKAGGAGTVLKLFIRDGFVYFAVVSLANLVQTGFFIQPIAAVKVINAFAALGLSSMMCCRLVLSLKSFNESQTHSNRYVIGNETELSGRGNHIPQIGVANFHILAKTERITVTDTAGRSQTPSAFLGRPGETIVDIEKALHRKESLTETLAEKDMTDEKSLHAH